MFAAVLSPEDDFDSNLTERREKGDWARTGGYVWTHSSFRDANDRRKFPCTRKVSQYHHFVDDTAEVGDKILDFQNFAADVMQAGAFPVVHRSDGIVREAK